jgi:hypothetical protein
MELEIPENVDPWAYLPFELACVAVSNITDISDIVRIMRTSTSFRQYTPCIQHLTNDKYMVLPASFLMNFINVQTAGHKIVFNVDKINVNSLKSLNQLQQATFYIDDIHLIQSLLQNLNGLNSPQHYFKIILMFSNTVTGILIYNNSLLVIPSNENIKKHIIYVKPNLISIKIPEEFKLWKKPMREFLLTSDFGSQELNNYIALMADAGPTNTLLYILVSYVKHHELSQGIVISSDEQMRKYFSIELQKNIKYRRLDLNRMMFNNLQDIISMNSIGDKLTVEDIVDYDFPIYIPSIEDFINIKGALDDAKLTRQQ